MKQTYVSGQMYVDSIYFILKLGQKIILKKNYLIKYCKTLNLKQKGIDGQTDRVLELMFNDHKKNK